MRIQNTRPPAGRWLGELRVWGQDRPDMRRVTRALGLMYGPEEATRISAALVERALMRVLEVHDQRLVAGCTLLEEAVNRLLDDREALSSGGALRSAEQRLADLRTLERQLSGLKRFEENVREIIDSDGHSMQTSLRNQMEAELGLTRSAAPVADRGTAPAGPPRLRSGTRPQVAAAVEELFTALDEARPLPVAPRHPGAPWREEPLSAHELAGTQSERVNRAAEHLVGLYGGREGDGIADAVRLLLAGADNPAERNRMVIAVLVAHGRLTPNARVPSTGPHVDAGIFQETVTGASYEWTGHLRKPVRGFTTIGVDGLVAGRVRDAKHTNVPVTEAGSIRGRVAAPKVEPDPGDLRAVRPGKGRGAAKPRKNPRKVSDEVQGGLPLRHRPWEELTTPDLITAMRTSEPVTLREQIIVFEERIGIELTVELTRQLEFARENGLRGVEWVVNSRDLARVYELIWITQVRPEVPGVSATFLVVGE
ncbi:hypothetical protein [Streptomyces sp. RKAG293]|uniref:hypothetical protein n=1 Tax=Streptomyces sp. RKAG293 TaxID=2893403 RepID=UPI002033343D|nr:hypothetical protein [Streptomyces sp. RKAG293]MCM2422900.1 hypothetical protein [Streptomyces sp. RKAG293]